MASYYDSWINDLKDELATAPDEYPAAGDYTGDTFYWFDRRYKVYGIHSERGKWYNRIFPVSCG